MKKRMLILLLLSLVPLLAACVQPETNDREYAARQFLTQLLFDDAELQQLILENVNVIGEGVPQPTAEELAAKKEKADQLEQLVEQRFAGLASPGLIEKNAKDGRLLYLQTLLATTALRAKVTDCAFTADGEQLSFEAAVVCEKGAAEVELPLAGSVGFDQDGLVEVFRLDESREDGLIAWLRQQETVALDEIVNQLTGQ